MIFLVAFLLEVFVLTVIEYYTWNTLYTPLVCLMLPYTAILLLTLMVDGELGFVPFNYESIIVWHVGLILFAIPSFCIGTALKKMDVNIHPSPQELPVSKFQIGIATVLCLLFMWKLKSTLSSSTAFFGTDEFAEDFAGTGVWPHLREILMGLIIMFIYYLNRKRWWLMILIVLMLIVQFLYMVKGSIIIAVCAGYLMRLYCGKSHLNLKIVLTVALSAFAVFILVYMVLPLMGNEKGEADMQLFEFVIGHFMHYLTSGILGWSYDVDMGIIDKGDISIILSPFINLFNFAFGSNEPMLSPVNQFYYNTGIALTNVRTFFGTLYIYTDYGQFTLYALTISFLLYVLKAVSLITNNIYLSFILFYYCGLLAMGWFEFYFFHLSIIEVPVLIGMLAVISFIGKMIPNINISWRASR